MGRENDRAEAEIDAVEDEIVKQRIPHGIEPQRHQTARRITKGLTRQQNGDGTDVEKIERPYYRLRKTHHLAR